MRDTILSELIGTDVKYLAMAAYANDYSQYVTTKEEYDMQHYEGASNLFGPFTLHAYQQEFRKLAFALKTGNQVGSGPPPPGNASPRVRHWRFRNLSRRDVEVKLYNTDDKALPWSQWRTLPNGTQTIRAHTEVAFPERTFTGGPLPTVQLATVKFNGRYDTTVLVGRRITIDPDGLIEGGV